MLFLGGRREAELILAVAEAEGDGVEDILSALSSSNGFSSIVLAYIVVQQSMGPKLRDSATCRAYISIETVAKTGSNMTLFQGTASKINQEESQCFRAIHCTSSKKKLS